MLIEVILISSFCPCRVLQEQNEGLQQSLLKTAVRMECLGEEFISSQKVLEEELQRTRVELSNLTERFIRSGIRRPHGAVHDGIIVPKSSVSFQAARQLFVHATDK